MKIKIIFSCMAFASAAVFARAPEETTVEEVGTYEAKTPIKLRKEPSVKSENVKCYSIDFSSCKGSGCMGESAVLPKGGTVTIARRTTKEETNSGAKGYWYQINGDHDCHAWVFGGLMKKIQQ